MRMILAAAILVLLASLASAQTTTSTTTTTSTSLPSFPQITAQGSNPRDGIFHIMDGQSCTGSNCEAPPLSVMYSGGASLLVDVTGTATVDLICRPNDFAHDPGTVYATTGSLVDGAKQVALTTPCHRVVPRITSCTSGTCKVRAWIIETRGNL